MMTPGEIREDELSVELYDPSPVPEGGQQAGAINYGVRVTHRPTGLVAESHSERSQLQNKVRAIELLKVRLGLPAWQCPQCLDWFGSGDDDKPPVCIMCRKAARRDTQ